MGPRIHPARTRCDPTATSDNVGQWQPTTGRHVRRHRRICQFESADVLDIRAALGRFLLAQDCYLCRAPSGDAPLCAGCERDLPALGPACPRCAMPSPESRVCGQCLADPPHFDRTIAVWRYAPFADALIHAFKYRSELALATLFAGKLASGIGADPAIDTIIPMPLHPARLTERGFNQALEIARPLARRLRLPVAARLARRTRPTADQTDLAPAERARNVRGAFECELDLAGRRLAVVDDVMTTGASLDELAHTLKQAGATWVENWIVARTVPRDD